MRLSDSLKQLGRPIVFYPKLADIFGIPESIFISHFVYWSDKGLDPEGWIYKTVDEIAEETGLSFDQQRRIRKVLTGTSSTLKGNHRTASRLAEPILLEKYERVNHRMFFRVDFDALDRAFSQGQLFPFLGGHMGIPQVPGGESPTGRWGIPRSSISESTTESTTKKNTVARKTAHKDFVRFFDDMAKKVRGGKPGYDVAGFRNLKLALATTNETTLERLALYYLADPKFKGYALDLKTFLSGGVMKALGDQQNKDGFVKRMDQYADTYLGRHRGAEWNVYAQGEALSGVIKNLAAKFALK